MDVYKIRHCIGCARSRKVRLKNLCDGCYRKARMDKCTKPCSVCNKLKPLVIADPKTCHTCNERNRRHEERMSAERDPVILRKIKERNNRNYIKEKEKGRYATIARRISTTLNRLKKRDPNTDITANWIYHVIVNQRCYYCGVPESVAKKITSVNLGIDRADPKLGYKEHNCVPACKPCNTAKFNFWSEEEALELGKVVATFYQRRAHLK